MSDTDVQRKNIDIVRTALENALAGRLQLAKPFFADDLVLYEADGLPFGGVYRGWEGYTQVLAKLGQFWSFRPKEVTRAYIPYSDDKVMLHFVLDANIAHNGLHVEMPIVDIFELKDGKISVIRTFYFDTKHIADLAMERS
jgi:ketosteroid isomerase-like protein